MQLVQTQFECHVQWPGTQALVDVGCGLTASTRGCGGGVLTTTGWLSLTGGAVATLVAAGALAMFVAAGALA